MLIHCKSKGEFKDVTNKFLNAEYSKSSDYEDENQIKFPVIIEAMNDAKRIDWMMEDYYNMKAEREKFIEALDFFTIKIGDTVKCIKPINSVHNFHDCDWFEEGLEFVVQYIGKNGNEEKYCGKEKDAGPGCNSIWNDWVIKIANTPETVCVTTPSISSKPRFKVGNKVRIIKRTWKNSTGTENAVGKVGYIGRESEWWKIDKNHPFFPEDKWIGKTAYYVIGNEDGSNYLGKFIDEEIELVKEETCPEPMNPESKFKAGDKVKILWEKTNYNWQDYSNYGFVESFDSDTRIRVDHFWPGHIEYDLGFDEDELELIEEQLEERNINGMIVSTIVEDEVDRNANEFMNNYLSRLVDNNFKFPPDNGFVYEHSFVPSFTTTKEKKSIMSIIKNIFKSDVDKAYEYFGFGTEKDINQSGINEFIQYVFETGNTEKAKFNEKIVEKYQEANKK